MCSQSLCRAAVFLHLRYTGDIGPAVCALMKKTAESTLKCLFWSKLKISSVPKPCNTPTEQDCNSNTSSKTTLRFGPLILLYLVLCKSHMVLQVSKIGPFLLPFSWPLPLEFSDRALSFSFEKLLILSQNRERTEEKEKKILSLLIAPLISFDLLGERTAPCLTDIQKRRPVIWQSSHLCWISLCHSICLPHNPSLRLPELYNLECHIWISHIPLLLVMCSEILMLGVFSFTYPVWKQKLLQLRPSRSVLVLAWNLW